LGERDDCVTLQYPLRDTWLGSTEPHVTRPLQTLDTLKTVRVRQRRLDDYLADIGSRRLLIKIDTEGSQLRVLRGGLEILRQKHPLVIFESWPGSERGDLFELLRSIAFDVVALPWSPDAASQSLDLDAFLVSAANDFIAVPRFGFRGGHER